MISKHFLKLVSEIGPHEFDDRVAATIMEITGRSLTRDEYGNWYCVIGESRTIFAAHLDTVSSQLIETNLYRCDHEGEQFILTAGTSILGADDRTGCAVLCHLMLNNKPGFYYFFTGEESGGIGSRKVADNLKSFFCADNFDACVEFDRFGTTSVITHQGGQRSVSDEWADQLIAAFAEQGLEDMTKDQGGSFTDSSVFKKLIPECTNISVGYYSQHSSGEHQNLTFLTRLGDAVVGIDWEALKPKRDPAKLEARYGSTYDGAHHGYADWYGQAPAIRPRNNIKDLMYRNNKPINDEDEWELDNDVGLWVNKTAYEERYGGNNLPHPCYDDIYDDEFDGVPTENGVVITDGVDAIYTTLLALADTVDKYGAASLTQIEVRSLCAELKSVFDQDPAKTVEIIGDSFFDCFLRDEKASEADKVSALQQWLFSAPRPLLDAIVEDSAVNSVHDLIAFL